MDQQTELTILRKVVAAWIFKSYADPAGLTAEQVRVVDIVGDAATALHERITAAGIDLSPELDELSAQSAARAFQQRMFDEGQKVYDRIVSREIQGVDAVDAALLDAHLKASAPENEGEKEAGHGDA